jgi:hypothetical protein
MVIVATLHNIGRRICNLPCPMNLFKQLSADWPIFIRWTIAGSRISPTMFVMHAFPW